MSLPAKVAQRILTVLWAAVGVLDWTLAAINAAATSRRAVCCKACKQHSDLAVDRVMAACDQMAAVLCAWTSHPRHCSNTASCGHGSRLTRQAECQMYATLDALRIVQSYF